MSNPPVPHQRAQLAWDMIVLACGVQLDAPVKREAMQKLVRAYGEARYEEGRSRESEIHQRDEMDRDVERLRRELDRRRAEVDA